MFFYVTICAQEDALFSLFFHFFKTSTRKKADIYFFPAISMVKMKSLYRSFVPAFGATTTK